MHRVLNTITTIEIQENHVECNLGNSFCSFRVDNSLDQGRYHQMVFIFYLIFQLSYAHVRAHTYSKVDLDNNRTRKLTERMAHPVGINAKTQANTSGSDKSVIATATAKPANANRKERPWMNRNKSWKLTVIFWLKVNTCRTEMRKIKWL